MKTKFTLVLLFVLILAACAPAATATEASATQPAQATEPPVVETPTLVVVPTQAPSLQVGSVHPYVDGVKLVVVPAGEFTMGGNGTDNPEHPVTLRDYWIYSTKVTNQQYALCVQLGKCTPPDLTDNPAYPDIQHANDPVTGVTYEQAATYCGFVGGRLPTEAEWEKAAGDSKGDSYPWGSQPPTCDLANFGDCAKGMTNVVDHSGGASYYGVLDMVGNAFEWVADWYDANFYKNSPPNDPSGPANGTSRVVRSSGFNSSQDQLSIFTRNSEDPQTHRNDIGFRCVVDQPDQFASFCESPLLYGTGSATSTCPKLEAVLIKNCAKNFPYTNVTITGATDPKITAQGCVVTNDPATVSCQPPNNLVSAQATCQVDVTGNPTCPAGYSLQGNTCIADGAQGACPAGLDFDASKQCCGLPAGADSSLKPAVCPVGTFYIASQNACLTSPVQELVTVSTEVGFKSCIATGGGGGGCEPPNGKCPAETDWNSGLCCCTEQQPGPPVCSLRTN